MIEKLFQGTQLLKGLSCARNASQFHKLGEESRIIGAKNKFRKVVWG